MSHAGILLGHERYMRRCLELASDALAAGEVPVGALILDGDRILGEGSECTRRLTDPSAHAEVRAVQSACRARNSRDLSGLTLYSTVEPCVLCAYVVRAAGIGHVVFGSPAGSLGGCTSSYALLIDASVPAWPPPPTVVSGILTGACQALLEVYAARRDPR